MNQQYEYETLLAANMRIKELETILAAIRAGIEAGMLNTVPEIKGYFLHLLDAPSKEKP